MMKGIETGRGAARVAIISVVAILSISLIENLPGFVVAPVFGKLRHVLPGGATETQVQLLAIVPNVVIIPFMLLSGWLCTHVSKRLMWIVGLAAFLLSSILYMFADSMPVLLWVSCLLGAGTGLILPLGAALITDVFAGRHRVRMMGWNMALSTAIMVPATYAVGWLGQMHNWHMPFVVYFLVVIPLALSPWLVDDRPIVHDKDAPRGHFDRKRLWQIIGVYFTVTLASMLISYYLPFLMAARGYATTAVGTAIAAFYLARFLTGMTVTRIVDVCGAGTLIMSGALIVAGIVVIAAISSETFSLIGVTLVGLGYGIYQPLLFDKTPGAISSPKLSAMAFAIILVADCTAYTGAPYVLDEFCKLVGAHSQTALNGVPMWIVAGACAVVTYLSVRRHRAYVFSTSHLAYPKGKKAKEEISK